MSRSKAVRPIKSTGPHVRKVKPGHVRVTVELTRPVCHKLKLLAVHKNVDLGVIVEAALEPVVAKFYVVDKTTGPVDVAAPEPPRLAVVEGDSTSALAEGETPTAA